WLAIFFYFATEPKYMDSFTDKELSLMESLASGINEARNIED
ncbi:TPA: hypothetical protein ACOM76_003006, partial [Staphylococcus aureus]